jgi:hypothetical protein
MKLPRLYVLAASLCIVVLAGADGNDFKTSSDGLNLRLDPLAESYVKLVLAVGQHDSMYVDSYYGPKEWLAQARSAQEPLEEIRIKAVSLEAALDSLDSSGAEEILQLRHEYLKKQLSALIARVEVLGGKKLTFDEEAKAYYDVSPPTFPDSHFQKIIAELDTIVPGTGPLPERIEEFRKQFVIPPEKLDTVFQTAIRECRVRTKKHIALPAGENFKLEFVHDKPWGGYNWYQGNFQSLIQVNIDYPTYPESVIDLAAHEGYPGHHVYNCLLESEFVRKRGWVEFTVYPLFSPQSLIAEGTANFGIEVAFPGGQRMEYERDVIFPLAGLDKSRAENYVRVQDLMGKLSYCTNEVARRYLDGDMSRDSAAQWLVQNGATSRQRAEGMLNFIDHYRSYVINYNLGEDLVRRYIDRQGGTADHAYRQAGRPEKRWEEFKKLISSPRLPSGLH